MILCSCNTLATSEMRAAAERLRSETPSLPVSPGRVFHALGARPQCGTCITLIRQTLMEWGFEQTCPEPLASIADGDVTSEAIDADTEVV